MRTTGRIGFERGAQRSSLALLPTVCAVALACTCSAFAAEETSASEAKQATAATSSTVSNRTPATAVSARVAEVIKMVDADVSTQVIITYIETSPSSPQPTEQDIIAMKEHKVDDEIVKLLLKRGATAREASNRAKTEAVMRVVESRRAVTGGLDAESYDYFRAYYLQPRAMASANQRLYPSYGLYGSRGYYGGPGWYGGLGFGRTPYYGYR